MRYRAFGRTGVTVSALGFGAMRLPRRDAGGKTVVDEETSIALIRRAFERGVTYVDTAYMYCDGLSERIVGKALKGWRDKVSLSTKSPLWDLKQRSDFRRILDEQLGRLDVACVDFYHFHGVDKKHWEGSILPMGLLDEMRKALDEKLIRFMSFSFHDKPEVMKMLVDTGLFSSVLCQYNLVDQANAEAMAHARAKGLGVVVMGPVGGGRLAGATKFLTAADLGGRSAAELALRFVLSNPDVDIALSGMSDLRQLEENASIAGDECPLSPAEREDIARITAHTRKLADLYCTGCGYCLPCPNDVNIPVCFQCMNDLEVYGFQAEAVKRYRAIGDPWIKGKRADACVDCGACEAKCPQKIPIRRQLKQVAARLGPLIS